MNWLDIVLFPLVGLAAWIGFRVGLMKALLGWAGLMVGVVLASRFYLAVGGLIPARYLDPSMVKVVIFILLGLVFFIGVLVAAWFLRRVATLRWADRLTGTILGLGLGALVVGVFLIVVAKFPFPGLAATLANSALARFLLQYLPFFLKPFPVELVTLHQLLL